MIQPVFSIIPSQQFLGGRILLLLLLSLGLLLSCEKKPQTPPAQSVGYEIFWRSFYDSDGDGIGDLAGLTEKLDTLNDGNPQGGGDLGINMIWLTPIFPSPSYHGYDITDYRGVHPEAGTMADMEEFIGEAHKRGIRVVLDLVLNHTSTEHPWFRKSAGDEENYRDWYVWRDKAPEGWVGFSDGGPWFQEGDSWYYALFWDGMPDLNYKNPAVYEEMVETARFWLDKGIDGFRLDAARYMVEEGSGWEGGQAESFRTFKFWKDFEADLKETHPDAFCIGEVWASQRVVDRYHLAGKGLDFAFDFSLGNALDRSLLRENRKYLNLYLTTARENPWSYYAPFWRNHDMDRYMGSLQGRRELAKTGMAVLLTLPGLPFLYYGEEIGMVNGPAWGARPGDADPAKRSPLAWTRDPETAGFTQGTPWKAPADPADPVNVEAQAADPQSLRSLVSEITHRRLAEPALAAGAAETVGSPDKRLFAFLRRTPGTTEGEGEAVLVLINLSDQEIRTELNFYGTTLAADAALAPLMLTAAPGLAGAANHKPLPPVTPETYGAYPIGLAPRGVALLKTDKLRTEPLPIPSSQRARSADILITADNRANAHRDDQEQLFLYGTFDSDQKGRFLVNNYGDVLQEGYPLYDDGTHGDAAAGDGIWTRKISLMVDHEDPYRVKFGTTPSAGGHYTGSLLLFVDSEAPRRVAYPLPPVVLEEDTTVFFEVDMKGVIGADKPGIRGSFTGDSWETHTPLYDDGTKGDKVAGDQIWSALVTFPAGSASYIEYKYNKDGASGWETRTNRAYIIDPSREINTPGEQIWDQ